MTAVIIAPRIEDLTSDVEPVASGGWFRIRPSRACKAGGQWLQPTWPSSVTNLVGVAVTVQLDPLTDAVSGTAVPYELQLHLPDGDGDWYEPPNEFRIVVASASPVKWEDLEIVGGPGAAAPPPSDLAARVTSLETTVAGLGAGSAPASLATLTGASTDGKALIGGTNTYAQMRGLLSVPTQTALDGVALTANAAIPSNTLGTGNGPAKLSADGLSVLRADGTVFTGGVAIGQVVGSAVDAARYAGDIQDIPVTIHEGDPRYNNHPITQRSVHYYGTTPITNNGDRVLGGGGLAPAGVTTGGVPIVDKWFQVVP